MSTGCHFCYETNREKRVPSKPVSEVPETTKYSMCDDCYSQYKTVLIIPKIIDRKIEHEKDKDNISNYLTRK